MTTTKDENNKKWNFLGIIDWHTQQIQQQPEDETKSDKPIQGLKLLYGHEWLLTLFLSLSLCLQLSLSLSLPLYLSPSIPLALYISLAIFIFFYYTHYSIFLSSKTTPFLKKAKMTERIALKGALSLVQINTHGLPKKKKKNQHTWIKSTYI